MCPLRLIPKIFLFNEEEIHPDLRAQRVLNKARIPEITTYLLNNPTGYIFSALTASVDAEIDFMPATEAHYNIGSLSIPMLAKFIINDGQHRRAAIEAALKERPELGDETIPIVLFVDLGLKNSQQMFSDLNRYAIRTTKSLNILYDYRDPLALMVKEVIDNVLEFKGLVETEKSTISNRSKKIFTPSGLYHATKELFSDYKIDPQEEDKAVAEDFWQEMWSNIIEWQMVKNNEISAADFRKDYINAHSITLIAIGRAARFLIQHYPMSWKKHLKKLQSINWHRENSSVWEGRVTIGGKISNSRNNLTLLVCYIKTILELPLTTEEKNAEQSYRMKVGA